MVEYVRHKNNPLLIVFLFSATGTNRFVQVCGAVTMLVLLGVPWTFSLFGSIESKNNKNLQLVEGVFQVCQLLATPILVNRIAQITNIKDSHGALHFEKYF